MTDDAVDAERCHGCAERPWNVRFRWEYTGDEQYCDACLLEPIKGQRGRVFLDYMPECQDVTHRVTTPAGQVIGGPVRYGSVRALYPLLTGRLR